LIVVVGQSAILLRDIVHKVAVDFVDYVAAFNTRRCSRR
jgi:hypothetical protein